MTMLGWLQEVQKKNKFTECKLRQWWHDMMEQRVEQEFWPKFFPEVLRKVNTTSH
jgi:hypothetical protein